MDLAGAVALVTGGNGGLGQRICHALAKEGVQIAVMYAQSRDQAEGVARELASRHQVNAAAFACDITDPVAVERVIGDVTGRFGRLDILVNDAAYNIAIPFTDLDSLTMEVWDKIIAINLTGPFLCTKHAARWMKGQGSGKIINIASVYGLIAPSKGLQVAYTASKHGVIGLTRVNAVELMPLGIQVNAIAPGYFFTEMTDDLRGTTLEESITRRTPSGRLGETSQLIGTCIYLASAASDHVSGICIPVDGG